MEKATIIYGHKGSGKREKTDEIEKQYNHVVRIDMWGKNLEYSHFLFDQVTKETDLIIIEGLKDDHNFEFWFNMIGGKIRVDKLGSYPFTRETPKLLFIIDKKPEYTGASFNRRFDLIGMKDLLINTNQ